ncbi:hypothetical protein B0I37DRAFT_374371 [Chaetomium sp. MPI-CAGE-AT-0009]|nr:hypothetical protein B0I37DRAFT_374371 [Chaetomium sp. MPI-CAGE-AT-0009]
MTRQKKVKKTKKMAGPGVYLLDYFPRAGFCWRRGQGSPRILRSDKRDAVVQRALIMVNDGGEVKLRKREAQRLVVGAVDLVAAKINDAEHGIRLSEGIIDYLERSADFCELSRAIGPEVWTELLFQIAEARNKYERETPKAQKEGDRDQLTALAFAIDGLVAATGSRWDWMSLEFYVYPHLVGEAADYEIDESGDESEEEADADAADDGDDDEGMGKDQDLPRQMGGLNLRDAGSDEEDEEDMDLPRQMEGLSVLDADGDVQMGM